MSGIAGLFLLNGQHVEATALEQMRRRIARRGPDGTSVWSEGCIGLVHAQLFTTPESLDEKQPLHRVRSGLTLVADARIDNRDELCRILFRSCSGASSFTDVDLILAAYERWGEACVNSLIGDFAFAIWDSRAEKLFCARDRFGVRPFYYWHRPGCAWAFGSEVKAILTVSGVPRTVNLDRVKAYLLDNVEDVTATFYKGVFRLPPASCVTINRERVVKRQYWIPDQSYELKLRSDGEYAEAFAEVFKESVRCQLRSLSPVGIALSGGIDSSSIACVAREFTSGTAERIRTFSVTYADSPEGDERPYINDILRLGSFDAHFLDARKISPLSELDTILAHADEPFDNPHFSAGWHLRRQVRDKGVRVLLDGNCGDNTLCYDFIYLAGLSRSLRLIRLACEAVGLSRHYFEGKCHPWRVAWMFGINPCLSWLARRRPSIPTPRAFHCRAVTHGVVSHGLEMANKADAAFHIESRHPFYDARLVDFCIALPREQRVKNGWTRLVMRRAFRHTIPDSILNRGSKWTPNAIFAEQFITHDLESIMRFSSEYRDWLAALSPLVPQIQGWEAVFDRYLKQQLVRDAYSVWFLMVLFRWLDVSGVEIGSDVAGMVSESSNGRL